jgi:diaminopropionate ammonia-lyase
VIGPVRHVSNPQRVSDGAAATAATAATNLQRWQEAVAEVRTWPEYEPQPLRPLPGHATRLRVGQLFYKDESQRFGRRLGSFKALGAPYTVFALLRDGVEAATGTRVNSADLRSGAYAEITSRVTVCVATDGNQGRGLAYGARTFGCRCVTYVHRHVSDNRVKAMDALGATVIRVDGEYEASVARAREDARMNGWHFVSSTSWSDFDDAIPRHVMNAYMVMVEEALEQLPDPDAVTHVFMQGGVGSIAAAIFLGFAERQPPQLPRFVVVEPIEADCLQQTARTGRPTPSPGSLQTIMAGLACREVSPAAWKILNWLASDYVAIDDALAVDAMRSLAHSDHDVPVVSGESAAGGMGVLIAAAADPALRTALGLDDCSTVVLFGGEGATDPDIYRDLVGATPDEIFERQAAKPHVTDDPRGELDRAHKTMSAGR